MRIRAPKDFWAGVMFCGFAAVAVLGRARLFARLAGRMGPGYFPLLLGLVLAGLGAILVGPLGRDRRRAAAALARPAAGDHRGRGRACSGWRSSRSASSSRSRILVVLAAWAGLQFRLVETRGAGGRR